MNFRTEKEKEKQKSKSKELKKWGKTNPRNEWGRIIGENESVVIVCCFFPYRKEGRLRLRENWVG